jgi:hypothetical protein
MPGEEVRVKVAAHDDDGVEVLEWGAMLNNVMMASEGKECNDALDCSIETTMTAPLEGVIEIYARASDTEDHETIAKDTLYVSY